MSLQSIIDFDNNIIEEVVVTLYLAGLSPRIHCANAISVYHVEEVNEFDGRYIPELIYLGIIHFQSAQITLQRPNYTKTGRRLMLELADPNFHLKLLQFFGIAFNRIQYALNSR